MVGSMYSHILKFFRFVLISLAFVSILSCAGVQMQAPGAPTAPILVKEVVSDSYALGQQYFKADGVERDYAKAAMHFQEAADQGNPEASYMLGIMHLNGWGFDKDIKAGARAFAKAAEQGHIESYYQLSVLFFSADAFGEAFKWGLPAAKENHAKAQFLMGMMFLEAGDQTLAVEWLGRSTALGYSQAAGILGIMGVFFQTQPDPSSPLLEEMLINPFE